MIIAVVGPCTHCGSHLRTLVEDQMPGMPLILLTWVCKCGDRWVMPRLYKPHDDFRAGIRRGLKEYVEWREAKLRTTGGLNEVT